MLDLPNQPGELIETPWMTVSQVAVYLSVTPGTIRNWVSQRRIPHVKRGRVVRFHRDRIDAWLGAGACPGRGRKASAVRVGAGLALHLLPADKVGSPEDLL